jgi:LysM repeat protein/predicted chitinase
MASYVVRPGDTLSAIAARNGTTIQALLNANPSIRNPNLIYSGQTIQIPNGHASPPGGGSHSPPSSGGSHGTHTYTVQRGDTLSGIAARNGTTVQAIQAANPSIHNPNLIYPGQVINIPGGGGSSPPPSGGGGSPPPAQSPGLGGFSGGSQNATVQAIITECHRQGVTMKAQIAYVLATTQHETAGSFQPVREAYYLGARAEAYRQTLRYYPYYGRGYVQLTWQNNYAKYGQLLHIDLVGNPDLALQPNVALFILVHGMKNGTFTGVGLSRYINISGIDFVNARRIVNGLDAAYSIANLAQNWLRTLG